MCGWRQRGGIKLEKATGVEVLDAGAAYVLGLCFEGTGDEDDGQ